MEDYLSIDELNEWNYSAEEVCEYMHIMEEHKGLREVIKSDYYKKCKSKEVKRYTKARYLILDYILECVKHDGREGDYDDEKNKKKLRKAGELLNSIGGYWEMKDPLVWAFIPQRFKRIVDICWNGIGRWMS